MRTLKFQHRGHKQYLCSYSQPERSSGQMAVQMEECHPALTTVRRRGTVPSQCVGRFPLNVRWTLLLAALPTAHCRAQKAAALVTLSCWSHTTVEWREGDKKNLCLTRICSPNFQNRILHRRTWAQRSLHVVQKTPARRSVERAQDSRSNDATGSCTEHDTRTPSKQILLAKGKSAEDQQAATTCIPPFHVQWGSSSVLLWLAGILVLRAERHTTDTLGEKLQYRMNFALSALGTKYFRACICSKVEQRVQPTDCSLIALMLHQLHQESTLLVAATTLSNLSSFIGSYWKTLPCHPIFSTIPEDSISSFFVIILRNAFC